MYDPLSRALSVARSDSLKRSDSFRVDEAKGARIVKIVRRNAVAILCAVY